ncbi:MAG: signal peptidase II [Planctomycetes bacterium]|nr:signal peptidase II [Planctomycetota bacterium]
MDAPSRPGVDAVAGNAAPAERSARDVGFRGKPWFWWSWPVLVAADLWSKAAVFTFLAERSPPTLPEAHRPAYVVFDGIVSLRLVSWGNPGTIWGLLPDATTALTVIRCVAVVGLFWFLRNASRQAKLQHLVLGLILAGAVGNLYDNFTRADRTVRDFLRFTGTWPVEWGFPAFNVADSCITVGAIGLFLLLWREDRAASRKRVS